MISVGQIFKTNTSGQIKIIEIKNSRNVTIQFLESGNMTMAQEHNIIKGKVKDRKAHAQKRARYGIGWIGEGPYSHKTHTTIYNKWSNMIQRCYSDDMHKREPSYAPCTCCLEWQCFQNFAKWYEENCPNDSYSLDKDILIKHNTIYSPETCCFVPPEINKLLVKQHTQRGQYPIGVKQEKGSSTYYAVVTNPFTKKVDRYSGYSNTTDAFLKYKEAKEEIIKTMAEKYKDQIAPDVYNALINYQIEITD